MLIHVTASHGDDWFTAPLLSPTGTLVAVTEHAGRGRDGPHRRRTARPTTGRCSTSADGGRASCSIWPTVANPLTGTTRARRGAARRATRTPTCCGRSSGASTASSSSSPTSRRRRRPPSAASGDRWSSPAPAATVTCPRRPSRTAGTRTSRPTRATCAASCRAAWPTSTSGPVAPRPGPTSRLLRDPAAGPADPAHQIVPGAMPRAGMRLDRRYVLGRRTDGQPVLWVQRRRTPLFAPPASQLRFDVLEEIPEIRP